MASDLLPSRDRQPILFLTKFLMLLVYHSLIDPILYNLGT